MYVCGGCGFVTSGGSQVVAEIDLMRESSLHQPDTNQRAGSYRRSPAWLIAKPMSFTRQSSQSGLVLSLSRFPHRLSVGSLGMDS